MQKTNNFNVNITFFITLIALLLVQTAESKNKHWFSHSFHTSLTGHSSNPIPSKKNHFSVAKKQIFLNDTIPVKTNQLKDTIPVQITTEVVKLDSLFKKNDSLQKKDSLTKNDSLPKKNAADTIKYKSAANALQYPVEYSAEDSMVLDVPAKTVTLYGKKANTNYNKNEVTAPIISFDQATGDIIATIRKDSLGKVISMPTYKAADFTSESDSIRFNMKSGKGITKGTYTQQGEMYVYGEVIKKMENDVFYALRGRFTTCNLDTPHFAFISNKIKFITDKVAISGPVHPEFEGIPIPIYFPFGIYPLTQGRHSGLLAPNFTTNEQRGLGLEGLGYYKVISDNWDVILRTSIYSYGGWSFNFNPRYSKRYHYAGNLSFDIQHFNINFKGDPDFSRDRSFKINWNHSADTKSRPGVTFSASVNAGSSSYNSRVPNNPQLNFSNQMQSSIRYSKSWKDLPFNLTVAANHNQNTTTKLINVSLPDVSFSMNTIYPFRKKEFAGNLKWYENIGIGYNGAALNRFSFYDTVQNKSIFKQIGDTLQWGARHSIPISLSLPQIGIFQLSPSVSYEETWYQNKITRYYDTDSQVLRTKIKEGFYTARQMGFGLSASTRIFGMIAAKNPKAKINAIRHEIRPSFSLNYRPDFNKRSYYYTQVDSLGHRQQFAYFDGGYNINGPYSPGTFGGFSFGVENNISMKVRNPKDTGENALKKVSLLDQLSLTGNYNFMADSFRLSPFSLSASTNLFDKVNISASGSLNPYQTNSDGRNIDRLVWRDHIFTLGKLTNANISLSSQFKGGDESKGIEPGKDRSLNQINQYGYPQDESDSELAYIRNNPGEFADFKIPWSVNLSYQFSYFKRFVKGRGFTNEFTQNINFGGTLNLTSKWQLGINGYYNIGLGQLEPLSLSVSRDLHCWQMSINLSPIGINRFYSINISPKSALLRDLKINRTRSVYTGF